MQESVRRRVFMFFRPTRRPTQSSFPSVVSYHVDVQKEGRMTSPPICIAILVVLLYPSAVAQWVPENDPRNGQASRLPLFDTNVPRRASLDFPTASSRNRLLTEFQGGVDPLRVKGNSYPFANDRFISSGFQGALRPAPAKLSPQSQIAVIDTAIARSLGGSFVSPPAPGDTTRHLYSFNANAKSIIDLTQMLRGDLWVDTLRQTNAYDANGKLTSYVYESWSNGRWNNYFRWSYTYHVQGDMLSELHESWLNGQWVNRERWTYTYDANRNMLSDVYEPWSSGQWMNEVRVTYTYDASGNKLSELQESWSNGQWMTFSRFTGSYDADKHLVSDLYEQFMNGQIQFAGRSTYAHDAQGNMLSRLSESYYSGQWSTSGRYTYTYDANGRQTSNLYEPWSNGQWVNGERGTITYDANGNQTSYLFELWSTDQWVNSERTAFAYDGNGHRLLELYESWSNDQWQNVERYTYTCDAEGNLTSVWHESWLNSSWTPTNIGMIRRGGGGFLGAVSDSAGNYYYFGQGYNFTFARKLIATGVESESGGIAASYSLAQNYPNPFNPSTTIRFEVWKATSIRLSVFDLLGREVAVLVNERRDAGVYEIMFDGSNLASGAYFCRLQTGDFVQSKTIVLLK
jgi:hypothetical protein